MYGNETNTVQYVLYSVHCFFYSLQYLAAARYAMWRKKEVDERRVPDSMSEVLFWE